MTTDPTPSASTSKPGASNLVIRLGTAAVAVPILLWMLFWAAPLQIAGTAFAPFQLLVLCTVAVSGYELGTMMLGPSKRMIAWSTISSIAFAYIVLYHRVQPVLLSAALICVIVGSLLALSTPEPIDKAGQRLGWAIASPLYAGGLVGLVGVLHQYDNGGGWVALAMLLAWWGDTGGYFAGRSLGKTKLYPAVSPNKTVEGSIGGIAGSIVGALTASFWFLQALPPVHAVILAIVAGALGQSGDLIESLIKRSAGVKDSGSIVPGHGGILDRIDALVMTGAAVWFYHEWFR